MPPGGDGTNNSAGGSMAGLLLAGDAGHMLLDSRGVGHLAVGSPMAATAALFWEATHAIEAAPVTSSSHMWPSSAIDTRRTGVRGFSVVRLVLVGTLWSGRTRRADERAADTALGERRLEFGIHRRCCSKISLELTTVALVLGLGRRPAAAPALPRPPRATASAASQESRSCPDLLPSRSSRSNLE